MPSQGSRYPAPPIQGQLESLSRDELIRIILDQQRMIEQLRAEIEQLKRRGGSTPFSKGTRKTDRKPPGRKPGQGFFRFRNAPDQNKKVEAVEVPVEVGCCPDCGGALGKVRREIVPTTDIPEQPQPEVCRYAVHTRACGQCGRKVRGQHPDIAAGQQGATAHRVGARVKALARILHYLEHEPRCRSVFEHLKSVTLLHVA